MFLCYKYDKISAEVYKKNPVSEAILRCLSYLKSVSYLTTNLNIIESGLGKWTTMEMMMLLGKKSIANIS